MKKILLSILFILILPVMAMGAGVVQDGSLTVTATAQALTSSISQYAKNALITVETGAVRWYCETTPTATAGHLLNVGDTLELDNAHDINAFRVIRNTGVGSATIYFSLSN